jgi:hypothetical protein
VAVELDKIHALAARLFHTAILQKPHANPAQIQKMAARAWMQASIFYDPQAFGVILQGLPRKEGK